MSVVASLLRAVDRADGEALVMHVGEKPYVVTATGHAELAAKPLSISAMTGMLEQVLPPESRQALDEFGAVEHHLPLDDTQPGLHYSIVAARGGDDIWIEVRRRKVPAAPPVEDLLPTEPLAPSAPEDPPPAAVAAPQLDPGPPVIDVAADPAQTPGDDALAVREEEPEAWTPPPAPVPIYSADFAPVETAAAEPEERFDLISTMDVEEYAPAQPPQDVLPPARLEDEAIAPPTPLAEEPPIVEMPHAVQQTVSDEAEPAVEPAAVVPEADVEPDTAQPEPVAEAPFDAASVNPAAEDETPVEADFDADATQPAPLAAVVVPIGRVNVRPEPPRSAGRAEALQHLLQVAAAQGASALYVAAQAKPSLRVDGEIRVLDETPLTEAQLEGGLLALLRRGQGARFPLSEVETCDVPEVGRVQCLGFRDHRGFGAVFKMLPARAISAEHNNLSAPIQALCTEPEGLVLVAGARGSGKSTLVAALVDQINRTRRDHVITIENQIQFVHENRTSFISQREAREEGAFVAAVRAAMREAPDVFVIDQVTSPEVASLALQAAANGHMVIASLAAPSTAAALGRFVDLFGEERAQARVMLSEHLRGVIAQTLLRKTGGGRAAAREVLVNVPAVSSLIADAQFDQLTAVLNGGRRVGMVPFNDALLGLVQAGALDVREAYRKSPDQQELVTLLNRAGLDTSFAERLA